MRLMKKGRTYPEERITSCNHCHFVLKGTDGYNYCRKMYVRKAYKNGKIPKWCPLEIV